MRIEDKPWLNLQSNEEVLYWSRPSLIMYANELMVGVFVMLAGIILPLIPQIPYSEFGQNAQFYPLVLIPIGLLILLTDLIRRKYRYYVVTTHKVVHKWGLPVFGTTSDPIQYDRMVNIKQHRGFWEYIATFVSRSNGPDHMDGSDENHFDGKGGAIGDIEVQTADDSETLRQGTPGDMYLDDIPDVGIVKSMIEEGMNSTPDAGAPSGSWGNQPGGGGGRNHQQTQPPNGGGQGGAQGGRGARGQGQQQHQQQPRGQNGGGQNQQGQQGNRRGQNQGGNQGGDSRYPDQ